MKPVDGRASPITLDDLLVHREAAQDLTDHRTNALFLIMQAERHLASAIRPSKGFGSPRPKL